MRYLVVLCDGTWNTSEDESVTNVRRVHDALDVTTKDEHPQLSYYQDGVGTEGDLVARLLGGIAGFGLDQKVMDAYYWLARTYAPGDRIALFGFSRGAYTARSVAGMIAACGLIDTRDVDESTTWRRIRRAGADESACKRRQTTRAFDYN